MKTFLKIFFFINAVTFPFLGIFAQTSATDITYLRQIKSELVNPVRIATDKSDNIYVTDSKQNCIVKYDKAGNFTEKIFLKFSPVSISVDENGDIYVGDKDSGNICRIDKNNTVSVFSEDVSFPSYLKFAPDGKLFVSDSKMQEVKVFDKFGNIIQKIGYGTLTYPSCIEYDKRNKLILVGEHGGIGTGFTPVCKVWVFDTEGNIVTSFGSYGAGDGEFYRIQSIKKGKCGNYYVLDTYQGSISVFDESFNFITKFGTYGSKPGELNIPLDILFNSDENITVSSFNNGSLEVFSIAENTPSSGIFNSDAVICNGETAEIKIDLKGTPPWNFSYTADGVNTVSVSTSETPYFLTVSNPGIYEITELSDAVSTGSCFTGSAVITLNDTPPSVKISTNDAEICSGDTAKIRFDLEGTPPWNFVCSDDNGTRDILTYTTPFFMKVTEGGKYVVSTVSDAYCVSDNLNEKVKISVFEKPVPDFDFITNNLQISFQNLSANSEYSVWNFGDGTSSAEFNPVHYYKKEGIYEVTLISGNNVCGETSVSKSVLVSASNVSGADEQADFRIYPNPSDGNFVIETKYDTDKSLTLQIINITGSTVFSKEISGKNYKEEINLKNITDGIYTVKIVSDKYYKTYKLVISK